MHKENLLNIFKPGTFTPMGQDAQPITFSDADLIAVANAYDPTKHRAPIIIGHADIMTAPAYGHVKALSFSGDGLEAELDGMDAQFAALVKKEAYPSVSAGFYPPNHPRNPSPGNFYLHEVSFLGAVPPAVRGLRSPSLAFSDDVEGIVRFSSEYDDMTNASLWRRLREWIIGKYGKDEADSVVPSYEVQSLEMSAQQEVAEASDVSEMPQFSSQEKDVTTPDIESLKQENARLKAKLDEQERTALRNGFAQFAESLCGPDANGEARLQSKHKQTVIDLLMFAAKPTGDDGLIKFGEGDGKADPVAAMKALFESLPPTLNFAEQITKDKAADPIKNPLLADAEARAAQARN